MKFMVQLHAQSINVLLRKEPAFKWFKFISNLEFKNAKEIQTIRTRVKFDSRKQN